MIKRNRSRKSVSVRHYILILIEYLKVFKWWSSHDFYWRLLFYRYTEVAMKRDGEENEKKNRRNERRK